MIEVQRSVVKATGKRVAVLFVLVGLVAGASFTWVSSMKRFQDVFYTKTDKFLMPTGKYWIAFGISLAFALIVSYSFSLTVAWLRSEPASILSQVLFVAIVVAIAPSLFLISGAIRPLVGISWDWLIAPALFLVAFSMCLRLLVAAPSAIAPALALNFLATTIALGIVLLFARFVRGASDWYLYVQWSAFDGLLLLSSAVWLLSNQSDALDQQPR